MSGGVMFGRCECCGKEKPLQRTYFRYPINCQCHNNQHFELIDHCADCMPQKPKETKVCLSVQQIDEIAALREENDLQRHSIQQLSAQVGGAEGRTLNASRNSVNLRPRKMMGPGLSKITHEYKDGPSFFPRPRRRDPEREKLEAAGWRSAVTIANLQAFIVTNKKYLKGGKPRKCPCRARKVPPSHE